MDLKKVFRIISIVLPIVLAIALWKVLASQNEAQVDTTQVVLQTIMERTSIRAYDGRSVGQDTIESILRAGMAAPTAMNRQPWAFIVVDDREVIRELADSMPMARMLPNAAFLIIPCGDRTKMIEGPGAAFWINDVSAASENMLIAIKAYGLGAVWTGGYPSEERVAILRSVLNIPDKFIPLNMIPVGHPAESPEPKNKWNPDNVYRNKFAADTIR